MSWTALETFDLNRATPRRQTQTLPPNARFFRFRLAFKQSSGSLYGEIKELDISTQPVTVAKSTRWNLRGTYAIWECPDSGLFGDRRLEISVLPENTDFQASCIIEYALGNVGSSLALLAPDTGSLDQAAKNEAVAAAVSAAQQLIAVLDFEPVGAEARAVSAAQQLIAALDFEPVGAEARAVSAAQQLIAALDFEPVGAEARAVSAAQQLISALTATSVGADPAGTAQALINALTAARIGADPAGTAQALINALTAARIGADPAGTAQALINALTAAKIGADPAGTAQALIAGLTAARIGADPAGTAQALLNTVFSRITDGSILYRVVTGGTAIINTVQNDSPRGIQTYQNASAVGQRTRITFYAPSGTYRWSLFTTRANNRGIIAIRNGSTLVEEFDFFLNQATGQIFMKEYTVAFANSGFQEISFESTNKNAASTGFFFMYAGSIFERV